jgi:hypothetical protein
MPIRVAWDKADKTIVRLVFNGDWTWADLDRASDEAAALIDTVDHKVAVLLDVRRARQIPGDFMNHAGRIADGHNPKRGILVVVGASMLMQTVGGALFKLFPEATKDVMMAGTMDEAYAVIERQRNGK